MIPYHEQHNIKDEDWREFGNKRAQDHFDC